MKMKMIVLAAAAVSLLAGQAIAADLTTKAPAAASTACQTATATTPLSCSGWYVGGGLAGSGGNADIIGSGIAGSVFAGGVVPTLDAGYQYASGNWFFGAEFDLQYQLGTTVTVNGNGSNLNGVRTLEFFKVGGNLASLLGTQTPITIPPQLAAAVIAPYVGVGPSQWWLGGSSAVNAVTSGAGVVFDIGPKWFGDLRYTYTNFNGAVGSDGLALQNDQSLQITFNYKIN
jgi:opacity protein-like surface antigen